MTPNFTIDNKDDVYNIIKFPSGELQVNVNYVPSNSLLIKGSIHSSDHIIELLQIVDAIKRVSPTTRLKALKMPYCAYSRQDRTEERGQAFPAKIFANLINSCEFESVIIEDAHSDVITALIDNCISYPVHESLFGIDMSKYDAFVAPDAGANKKVFKCCEKYSKPFIRADKVRDFSTGRILETSVYATPEDLASKRVLIIDDICDGGRTFIELAKVLKDIEPSVSIDLFVSHGFFYKGLDDLRNAGIETFYSGNTTTEGVIQV